MPIAGLQCRVQGLNSGSGTLLLWRTVGWAQCNGSPDAYRVGGCILLGFVLFQEVHWKEKELCWPVSGMSV